MSEQATGGKTPPQGGSRGKRWGRRRQRAATSLFAAGEPMVWLTGGALVICVVMVAGLLGLVFWKGLETFWPQPLTQVTTHEGQLFMGEMTRDDRYRPESTVIEALGGETAESARSMMANDEGWLERRLFRTGNYRLTQVHFRWVDEFVIAEETRPEWAMLVERMEWGRFYGFPEAFLILHPVESADDARMLAEQLEQTSQHELALLDKRWIDGSERRVLIPTAELDQAGGLVAVAEVARGAEAAWQSYTRYHREVRERWEERRNLEKYDTGEVNHEQERARLAMRKLELELEEIAEKQGADSKAYGKTLERFEKARETYEEKSRWALGEFDRIRAEIDGINAETGRYQLLMRTPGEGDIASEQTLLRLDGIVRAYLANRLGTGDKLAIYFSRWKEFLVEEPREANAEGGVFPAIFGTVAMTLIMSLAVVPFGVLAALYLREYAKAGPLVSAVRIAVNNLAGVPSIVFGVFGLGFFCYLVGASIDELLFAAHLPNPTYGKGGLLWASFTLALLTLPVVIVATEEAVSAVPNSMREGSYACGASKWQTIRRIVLPRALPGIITGMILAIARGAGEVAPLMLVGAVKLAPELPVDGMMPFVHPERSFMHLGFHIFDVGFQSPNAEAAKPMVFTTTLLLIGIIATLNLATIWLRNRLRRKFAGGQF